jgi:hypothetical protein
MGTCEVAVPPSPVCRNNRGREISHCGGTLPANDHADDESRPSHRDAAAGAADAATAVEMRSKSKMRPRQTRAKHAAVAHGRPPPPPSHPVAAARHQQRTVEAGGGNNNRDRHRRRHPAEGIRSGYRTVMVFPPWASLPPLLACNTELGDWEEHRVSAGRNFVLQRRRTRDPTAANQHQHFQENGVG